MELELKFALPAPDPQLLERLLAQTSVIGKRRPKRQRLHNTYYDTPEHALQSHKVALRVRQLGTAARPAWVQTLKTGGKSGSALSQRGEWEEPVRSAQLDRAMLAGTPWAELDPEDAWFDALVPMFTTSFERLSWIVSGEGFSVEVALDRGSVLMDGHSAPLCELEIELLSGPPEALFDTARQIGQHLALLPLHMSKAERAYRLAQGTLDAPLRARPPALQADMALTQVAHVVLRESFLQFTANLNNCRSSEAPEVLHQARVGWRRFRSALKLFRLDGDTTGLPALTPLKPLLARMAALRDLDVADTEVFAQYALAYQDGNPRRARQWAKLEALLAQARQTQRLGLLQCLGQPALGCTLLEITRWLELGSLPVPTKQAGEETAKWLKKRVAQLAKEMRALPASAPDALAQHRLRILAKRLRYNVENLLVLLPKKRAERWHRQAVACQSRIGLARDQQLALDIAAQLKAPEGIVEFLRGAQFSDKRLRPFP